MSTDHDAEQTPTQTAVWYFIGATFIFTMPNLLFPDLAWWSRFVFIGLGFAVMVAGFVQLRKELAARRRPDAADGDPAGSTPSDPHDPTPPDQR